MFGRNRDNGETLPTIHVVSAVPAEGRVNIARVVFDVGVDKPYVVCGIPIRPIGIGLAYREMVEATVVHEGDTIGQLADFVVNGTLPQTEVL